MKRLRLSRCGGGGPGRGSGLGVRAGPSRRVQAGMEWAEPKVVDPGPVGGVRGGCDRAFRRQGPLAMEGGEQWIIKDGYAITNGRSISTKQPFGDMQLHVEWATPTRSRAMARGAATAAS